MKTQLVKKYEKRTLDQRCKIAKSRRNDRKYHMDVIFTPEMLQIKNDYLAKVYHVNDMNDIMEISKRIDKALEIPMDQDRKKAFECFMRNIECGEKTENTRIQIFGITAAFIISIVVIMITDNIFEIAIMGTIAVFIIVYLLNLISKTISANNKEVCFYNYISDRLNSDEYKAAERKYYRDQEFADQKQQKEERLSAKKNKKHKGHKAKK